MKRVTPADYPHQVLGLWQRYSAMEVFAGIELLRIGLPVRCDLLTPAPWEEIEDWSFLANYPEPKSDATVDWMSLGHDVCDKAYCSGLTNCGYNEQAVEWRARWESKLNEHGLLIGASDSFEFCAATNIRVSGHAPFFVFELLRPMHWPSAAIA